VIVEYRLKSEATWQVWQPVNPSLKFEDLNMENYSIRINKDKQYHRIDTKGFKEAYNKSVTWMRLTGEYDTEWQHW